MHLKAEKHLVAYDNEGRMVLGEYFPGDEVQFLDARGTYQYGQLLEVLGSAITIYQDGKTRRIPFIVIEHIAPLAK